MAMVDAKVNYNFHEEFVDVDQVYVANESGVDFVHLELVLLETLFGEVMEFDGIADGALGYININSKRLISTTQIDVGDTFVVGDPVYFHPGNKVLEVTSAIGNVAVGKCTAINNGVAVEFMPYVQNMGATGLVVTA